MWVGKWIPLNSGRRRSQYGYDRQKFAATFEAREKDPAVGCTAVGSFLIALFYFLSFRYQVIDNMRLGQC